MVKSVRDALSQVYAAPVNPGFTAKGERMGEREDWSRAEIKEKRALFIADLHEIRDAFNAYSKKLKLGVSMCTKKFEAQLRSGVNTPVTAYFGTRGSFGGRIYENQLRTAQEAFVRLIIDPTQSGIILGAMQSGKTGTSLALQFFGPVYYLLTGIKIYPLYMLTSLTSHEQQTKDEFENFLLFYGDIEFKYKDKSCTLLSHVSDATPEMILSRRPVLPAKPHNEELFRDFTSLNNYRQQILGKNGITEIRVEDFIRRRVHGKHKLDNLRQFIAKLSAKGFQPLVIVDESQHGASMCDDGLEDGEDAPRCVLRKTLDQIEKSIGQEARVVCLSATPFDISGMISDDEFWCVRQRLPRNYSGFNMWLGDPIDPEVDVQPPVVESFADYGRRHGVDFLRFVNMAFYLQLAQSGMMRNQTFDGWATESGFWLNRRRPDRGPEWNVLFCEYRQQVQDALRDLIHNVLGREDGRAANGRPRGMCVRFCNNNTATRVLLQTLALGDEIEVLHFYEYNVNQLAGSVKKFLSNRSTNRPYLIVVTSKARMGDAFPVEVEDFIDFSNARTLHSTTATMNALLQGLLGRACGAGKRSTVCLSPGSVATVRDYIADLGRLRINPSTHAVTDLGGGSRKRRFSMAKVSYDQHDPVFNRVLDRVNREIVDVVIGKNSQKLDLDRWRLDKEDGEYVPLFRIFEEEGLYEHIRLNPTLIGFPGTQRIEGDVHPLTLYETITYKDRVYGFDYPGREAAGVIRQGREGWVYAGFRQDDGLGGRGGRGGNKRRPHAAKTDDPFSVSHSDLNSRLQRVRNDAFLEFMIHLVKVHPVTGERIYDDVTPGDRKAVLITIPLMNAVVGVGAAETSKPLPRRSHAFSGKMAPETRERREGIYANRDAARLAREVAKAARAQGAAA